MDLSDIIITNITGVFTVFSPRGRTCKMVNREHYGLSFTAGGQITYTHNGNSFVSDCNHAVILPKGQTYSLHGDLEGVFPVIDFECSNFYTDTILVLPVENVHTITNEFEQMKNLFLQEKNRLMITSLFYRLLSRLIPSNMPESNQLAPAMEYLENNYASNITNAILAEKCNISEVYFRKLFSKTYNVSPKQYMIDIRINKAKQLLAEGYLKIYAISEQCGFSNPYHFCRFFKQKTGLTPTEYMRRNKICNI